MKNAANMICAVSKFPITAVQVNTPNAKSNDAAHIVEYNADEEWDNLCDNNPVSKIDNRYTEIPVKNIRAMISRENIVAHIEAYDYKAAYRATEDIENYLSEDAIRLIRAGALRINLSISEAGKEANAAGYDLYPVKTGDIQKIFEYLQYLNIKNKRKEMADFIIGISPLVSDLFEKYLEEKCKINISQFCSGRSIKVLIREKMNHDMQTFYNDYFNRKYGNKEGFRNGFLCAGNILPMIMFMSKEPRHKEVAENLRSIEEKTRNKVAHEIIEVTDEWLKRESGFSSDEIQITKGNVQNHL